MSAIQRKSTVLRLLALLGVGATLTLGLTGCRGEREESSPRQFFPDMDDQEKFKPQHETEFFPDHRAMRPVVPGTVAYGRAPIDHEDALEDGWGVPFVVQRARLLKEDQALFSGTTNAPSDQPEHYLNTIPIEVTMDTIRLGQEQFDIYCAVCHGYEGDGYGTVGDRYAVRPANFHDPKYMNADDILGRDGYIYDVARNGLWDDAGNMRMPAYGHALDEYEAWAVVAYIRTLQASRNVPIDAPTIPGAERSRLLEQRGGAMGAGDAPTNENPDAVETIAEGGDQ